MLRQSVLVQVSYVAPLGQTCGVLQDNGLSESAYTIQRR